MIEMHIGLSTGHLPGALSHAWRTNFGPNRNFRTCGSSRQQFRDSLGILRGANTVYYCGRDISARHNVQAQIPADGAETRLYCGSWSEWCRDRGIARGQPQRGWKGENDRYSS